MANLITKEQVKDFYDSDGEAINEYLMDQINLSEKMRDMYINFLTTLFQADNCTLEDAKISVLGDEYYEKENKESIFNCLNKKGFFPSDYTFDDFFLGLGSELLSDLECEDYDSAIDDLENYLDDDSLENFSKKQIKEILKEIPLIL